MIGVGMQYRGTVRGDSFCVEHMVHTRAPAEIPHWAGQRLPARRGPNGRTL